MKKLRAAIVDDELHCVETLQYDLKEYCANKVEIIFTCTNGVECINNLKKTKPDVLFIDIEMPGITGFELLNILEPDETKVVFTTAHARHAVEAIKFKPEAYLLKPIDTEELVDLVDSLIQNQNENKELQPISNKLAISTTEEIELIPHESIVYARASNNYTEIITDSGKEKVISKTLKFVSGQLPDQSFFRIHKSYLINLNHIIKYRKSGGGSVIMSNNEELPVSTDKKEKLLSLIQDRS